LQLDADIGQVNCEWCRETSYVERRLRTIELEIKSGVEPGAVARDTKFIPAHSIAATGKAESSCPGCGGVIEITRAQEAATCPHCGSAAKVERRLVASEQEQWESKDDDHDLEMFKAGTPRDFEKELYWDYGKLDDRQKLAFLDEWNDQRVRVLLTSDNADTRLLAAATFQAWHSINPWRERMISRLMRLAGDCDPALEWAIASRVIQRNLQMGKDEGEEVRRAVFRAAGRALFTPNPSGRVLKQLGEAFSGATLKLMMELMDYAFENGSVEAAIPASRAAAMALGRAYQDRKLFGEVMLYRLLYLRPPMLAWVMDQCSKWQVEDRLDVLRFLDDCAVERPELVPVVRDQLGAQQWFPNLGAYRAFLGFVGKLATPLGRDAALQLGVYAPEGAESAMDDLSFALEFLHPMLSDPVTERTATSCLNRFVARLDKQDLPPLHDYVEKHGDELPWRVRQQYLRARPDTKLLTPFQFRNTHEDKPEPTALEQTIHEWQERFRQALETRENDWRAHSAECERVVEEHDKLIAERKAEWRRQEEQQEANERDLREADVAADRQQIQDDYVSSTLKMFAEQAAQQREYYREHGDKVYLRTAENLERQAERFKADQTHKPKRPWIMRWLTWFGK
jgi:hypothetical protein